MAEPVEPVIRAAMDAYRREGFAGSLRFGRPDIEIYAPPGMLNAGTVSGGEQATAWAGRWEEAWEDIDYELQEVRELGSGVAVARVHVTAHGSASGIAVDMRQGWFFELRDGKLSRWHLYPDFEEALRVGGAAVAERGG